MTFGVITGGVVALCCYNESYNFYYEKFLRCRKDARMQLGIWEPSPTIPMDRWFRHHQIFIALLKSLGRGYNHILAHITRDDRLLTRKNEIIILLPDLHLHALRETLVDNFVQVEVYAKERQKFLTKGLKKRVPGKSLEEPLFAFLEKLLAFKAQNQKIKIEIIQLGDMYEMWETNYALHLLELPLIDLTFFQGSQSPKSIFADQNYQSMYITLMKESLPKLPPGEMRNMIEKKYPKLFSLFNKDINQIHNGKAKIPFRRLQGNHDNYLYWRAPHWNPSKSGGIFSRPTTDGQGIIHAEHGHFSDVDNYRKWKFIGYPATCVNVLFEARGKGPWIKTIPSRVSPNKRRECYLPYASATDQWYRRNKGKPLAVFCMAHTHEPYICSWS